MNPIVFLSLFFGLLTGPYPIELAVEGPVSTVEVSLDGRVVKRLAAPPWEVTIDLGARLEPHEIVARALDAGGAEIGRARETANLPKSPVKVDILLEEGADGRAGGARVAWTSLRGDAPRAISLYLDGEPLKLDASFRANLPQGDPQSIHLLTAEVDLAPARPVRRERAYGGAYGSEAAAELTSVPLKVPKGRRLTPEALAGRLEATGAALKVAAVEEGPAQLVVVRSPDVGEMEERLGTRGKADLRFLKLDPNVEISFIFPWTERFAAGQEMTDLFQISPWTPGDRAFPPLLRLVERIDGPAGANRSSRRIADAVAVAGLEAVRDSRRRAVLLILSGREKDESRFSAAEARHLLASIHVPLFVWTFHEPAPGSQLAAWGEAVNASYGKRVEIGVEAIRKELRSQRIALIDGMLLPQSIRVVPGIGDDGLTIAGQAAP